MKKKNWWFAAIIFVLATGTGLVIYNCREKPVVTGWDYNSPSGGFEKIPYQEENDSLILIEGGEFKMGTVDSTWK